MLKNNTQTDLRQDNAVNPKATTTPPKSQSETIESTNKLKDNVRSNSSNRKRRPEAAREL